MPDVSLRKTVELVAEQGDARHQLDPLFAALGVDPIGSLDGVRDLGNMPLKREPQDVRDQLTGLSL